MGDDVTASEPNWAKRVDELVARCIVTAETEGSEAVDQLLSRHPDIAAAVRHNLAGLD